MTTESYEDAFIMWALDTPLPQSGLDPQQQWYLCKSIREFVKDSEMDVMPTALCAPAYNPAEQGSFAAATEEGRWR